jgi:hypothetical protein
MTHPVAISALSHLRSEMRYSTDEIAIWRNRKVV